MSKTDVDDLYQVAIVWVGLYGSIWVYLHLYTTPKVRFNILNAYTVSIRTNDETRHRSKLISGSRLSLPAYIMYHVVYMFGYSIAKAEGSSSSLLYALWLHTTRIHT